jgi:hypothetical protein
MQWEHYYTGGDDGTLRLLSELFERGSGRLFHSRDAPSPERVVGSVHEVEAVRKRCVEGAVISNLDNLRAHMAREFRRASYAGVGLAEGTSAWLQALQSDLHVFVEALLLCTQSRKLSRASLLEVRARPRGRCCSSILRQIGWWHVRSSVMLGTRHWSRVRRVASKRGSESAQHGSCDGDMAPNRLLQLVERTASA